MNINNIVKTGLLEKALDASVMRNEAITQNMANVDTPNYKRKKVTFEEALADSTESLGVKGFRTNSKHIPIGGSSADEITPTITQDTGRNRMRIDGNNVDPNIEMADLAKNTLKYSFLIQKLSGEFRKIKSAIAEGRR